MANEIKQSVKGAINFVSNFEDNARALTKQKGYDVTVCGHIHQPTLKDDYMNSGDFCENSTCLVEDFDGKWSNHDYLVIYESYHHRIKIRKSYL